MENGFSRVDRVVTAIEERIDQRSLLPGAKLPSIRQLAKTLSVSKSTVVEAYDRMTASGLVRSHAGSGFYVVGRLSTFSTSHLVTPQDQTIDALWAARRSLEQNNESLKQEEVSAISSLGPAEDSATGQPLPLPQAPVDAETLRPGAGSLPPSWMPMEEIRRTIRKLSRAPDASIYNYGTAYGSAELRALLGRRLADRGIEAAADQIMLTDSGLQAVDLVCRLMLKPGDTVVVNDPCYFNFLTLLRAHPVNVVGIPFTEQGPSVEAFQAAVSTYRPRLYLTNSGPHNPTGATMTASVAYKLLTISAQSGVTIVEDDVFADFEHEQTPRFAALDALDQVVHVGSFSKILTSGTRCGYIAANRELVDKLVDIKVATCFGGNPLTSHIVHGLLIDGSYRKHINTLKPKLARAMNDTLSRLEAIGLKPWILPKGGLFIWVRLPDGFDSADISRSLLDDKIAIAPGNLFSLTQSAGGYMRFNVSRSNDPRIFSALADRLCNV